MKRREHGRWHLSRDVVISVVANLLASLILWVASGARRHLIINGPKEVFFLVLYAVTGIWTAVRIIQLSREDRWRTMPPVVLIAFFAILIAALPYYIDTFINLFTNGWGPYAPSR